VHRLMVSGGGPRIRGFLRFGAICASPDPELGSEACVSGGGLRTRLPVPGDRRHGKPTAGAADTLAPPTYQPPVRLRLGSRSRDPDSRWASKEVTPRGPTTAS